MCKCCQMSECEWLPVYVLCVCMLSLCDVCVCVCVLGGYDDSMCCMRDHNDVIFFCICSPLVCVCMCVFFQSPLSSYTMLCLTGGALAQTHYPPSSDSWPLCACVCVCLCVCVCVCLCVCVCV